MRVGESKGERRKAKGERRKAKAHRLKPVLPLPTGVACSSTGFSLCGVGFKSKRKGRRRAGDRALRDAGRKKRAHLKMIRVIRETQEAPEDVARELLLAGGRNRFGEANYRAVWGWSRLDWIGGKWEDRDAGGALVREVVELRREPKYLARERWHIERWMPPESYGSPEAWRAETLEFENGRGIAALGPYPARGDYEHCFTLEGPAGEFVQLTAAVARHIARAIEAGRGVARAKSREALLERAQRQEREYDAHAEAVLSV